jgi:ferredoxin-NAD(P)+ reductase (naphthalene dioxygenase ferredoxin-specific)
MNKIKLKSKNIETISIKNKTVLDSLLEASVEYPYSCKAGRCGTCKIKLVSGQLETLPHPKFTLSEEEKGKNIFLACKNLAITDVEIEIVESF